ncbi:MAG: TonB-dependent receptor domain-containing protein, partial [Chitinophagales bacterium]
LYYSYFNSRIGVFAGSHIGNLTDLENAFTSDTPLVYQDFTYHIGKPYQFIEHHLLKSKHTWNTNFGNLEAILAYQDDHRSEYDTRRSGGDAPNLYFEIGTINADVLWKHPAKNSFNGTIGINGMRQQNITDGDIFIPNYHNYSGGFYAIEKYTLHNLTLEGGLRYDYRWLQIFKSENDSVFSPESSYANLSWQLGAIYRPNTWLRIQLNSGTAWRAPSVSELYSDGLHHGAAALEYGDSALQTEVLYGNSISTHVHLPKVHFDIDMFYNLINNYIYLKPSMPPVLTIAGAFPVFKYAQTDAQLYGIDASLSYEFIQYFLAELRASVVRGRDIIEDSWLVQMPADRVSMALHYSLNNKNAVYFNVKGEYTFKQTRYEDGNDYVPPPDAYTLFSAETGGLLFAGIHNWEWSISAENILNVAYRNYMNRLRYFADEAGINIMCRLKIPFKK